MPHELMPIWEIDVCVPKGSAWLDGETPCNCFDECEWTNADSVKIVSKGLMLKLVESWRNMIPSVVRRRPLVSFYYMNEG